MTTETGKKIDRRNMIMNNLDYVSLREYLETKIANVECAVRKAEDILELRLEGMNQFRDQIENERINYITKDLYEAHHSELQAEVANLERLVFIGLGIVLTLELVLRFVK